MTSPGSIGQLASLVAALSPADRARFARLFHLDVATGDLVPPEAMHGWLAEQFGSVGAVRRQRIVKVTNRITLEGALFNTLRASQPIEAPSGDDDVEAAIERAVGDPFCRPWTGTPADTFGRIQGRFAVTASNVAKYDGLHAVIVFDEHHPLRFSFEQMADYLDVAQRWARAAQQAEPEACYPFFLWNCLWRSGASILHGHAQMTLTRGLHYARVEAWRQAAVRYRAAYQADYFADLIAVHRSLGLVAERGTATILPSLTPFKERETHIVAAELDGDLKAALYELLQAFIQHLAVNSFNLVLYQPPLAPVPEDWQGFPFVFRLIDRGGLANNRSDIGSMEMYAQSVVTTDPFHVIEALEVGNGVLGGSP